MKKIHETEQDGLRITYYEDKNILRREIYNGQDTHTTEVKGPARKHYVGFGGILMAELGIAGAGMYYLCANDPPYSPMELMLRIISFGSLLFLGPGQVLTRGIFDIGIFGDYNRLDGERIRLQENIQQISDHKKNLEHSKQDLENKLADYKKCLTD